VAIAVGQEAPDFTLANEDNEPVTLSELRGAPVVLVFYAWDFSGICQNELCDIRDNRQDWIDLGAHVYGISRDQRFSHKAVKEANNLPMSLLADTKGEVAKAYDTWNEDVWAAERSTIVIDKNGVITHIQKNPIPEARDHSDITDAVKAAL
jgi:peroxiredoxin